MDQLIQKLCEMDIGSLVVMAAMLWFFKSHLDKKFEKTDLELKDIKKDIQELRTSINRMEEAFYNNDCCVLKNNEKQEKVQSK